MAVRQPVAVGAIQFLAQAGLEVGKRVGVGLVAALRYVSLGSLIGTVIAVVLAFTLYFTGLWQSPWGMVYVALGSAMIIWRHQENLKRLAAGKELQLAAWPTYFKRVRPRR